MRLIEQSGGNWRYHLRPREADILRGLLGRFPFTAPGAAAISRTDGNPAARERETLLQESMAEHREQLKQLAMDLLAQDRWEETETGWRLTLDAAARETLLQILNDIRIGCWQVLGEPEDLDIPPAPQASPVEVAGRNLIELAADFQAALLETDGRENDE